MIPQATINPPAKRGQELQSINFGPFSEGMFTSLPLYGLTDSQFSVINNYEIELNGLLKVRKGYWPLAAATADSVIADAPVGMYVGSRGGSDIHLVHVDEGATDSVRCWTGSAWLDIKTGLTSGKYVDFLKYSVNEAEDILFFNGEDTPQRWTDVNETEAITGGTKGATTLYTVASTTGMVVGRTMVVSGCTITDYNVSQVITAIVADTSVTTDLVSTGFSDNPGDGTITVRGSDDMGLAIPTATVAGTTITRTEGAESGDRGIEVSGTLYYKYTYFYDDSGATTKYGESGPSTSASVAVTGAAGTVKKVTHDYDAAALPTGVSKILVYRAPLGESAGPYRLVGELTAATDFVDITPIDEEGISLSLFDSVMPTLKYAAIAGGRIVAIDGDLPSKIIWSQDGYPDVFPALNYAYLPEEGTGVAVFGRNVYAFTENNVYILADSDFEAANFVKVCNKGCISHKSIQDVGNGLIWLGKDNIYWADFNTQANDGDFPIPVGEPVRDKVADIPASYAHIARSAYMDNRYYLAIPGLNQTENTQMLTLSTLHGIAYTLQGKMGGWTSLDWNAADIIVHEKVLYSIDTDTLYMYKHNSPYSKDVLTYADYGTTTHQGIQTSLETGWLALGSEWSYKLAHSVSLAAESTGVTFTAQASLRDENNNEVIKTAIMTLGDDSITVENDWLVWDVGNWAWDASESGDPGYDADEGQNWAAVGRGMYAGHKRYKKGGKGLVCRFGLYSADSLDARVVQIKEYFRNLRKAL